MLFFMSALVCLSSLAHTISSQKLILKIEYNARTDKQTTVNNINITFINKTAAVNQNGGISIEPENSSKSSYDKCLYENSKNSIKSNKLIPFTENNVDIPLQMPAALHDVLPDNIIRNTNTEGEIKANTYNMNPMPSIQNKGDNKKIKQRLHDFAMIKKETYISTPIFNFPASQFNYAEYNKNNIKSIEQINPKDENQYEYFNTNVASFENQKIFQEANLTSYPQNRRRVDDLLHYASDNYKPKYDGNFRTSDVEGKYNSEILNILNKQNVLIEKIANRLLKAEANKKRIARTDFQDIIESIEAKQTKKTTTAPALTTTVKLSTLVALIDETEIREALKKDPFVRRILKLANRKRQEYEKRMG